MRDQAVSVFCKISFVNLKQKLDELLSFCSLINIKVNIKLNNEMVAIAIMIKVKANSPLMMGMILCSADINTSNKIMKEWKSTSYWEVYVQEVYLRAILCKNQAKWEMKNFDLSSNFACN